MNTTFLFLGAGGAGEVAAQGPSLLMVLIPVVVPVVIAVIKFFLPKIPKAWLPILAPILGALAEFISTGSFDQGTIWGAVAGAAGVGLREIVDQLKKARAGAEG